MICPVASKRELERDARHRAAEVPPKFAGETAEAPETALGYTTGDLKTWLQTAVKVLRDQQHY
jgi:hypothetical protein